MTMIRTYKYYSVITGLFTATLLISNTLDSKLFQLGSLTLPCGIILFPLAYLFGDVLTEVYGYAASRKVIWTGFISLILMVGSYEIARQLPAASFWQHQDAFDSILRFIPRIALASVTAFWAGEFCNSYVLAKIKVKMRGRAMSFRLLASTVVGQAIDTAVFAIIAYSWVIPFENLFMVAVSGWAFKVIWEALALPFTLKLVRYLKHVEGVDYFDDQTDFNPFRVEVAPFIKTRVTT